MSSNRADDAVGHPPANGWLYRSAREFAPDPSRALAGIFLGLALFSSLT